MNSLILALGLLVSIVNGQQSYPWTPEYVQYLEFATVATGKVYLEDPGDGWNRGVSESGRDAVIYKEISPDEVPYLDNNHPTPICMVAYCGTETEDDWLGNFNFIRRELISKDGQKTCGVYGGYLSGFQDPNYFQQVDDFLFSDTECANSGTVVFTGHSQGGGIASIASLFYSGINNPMVVSIAPAAAFGNNCEPIKGENVINIMNSGRDDIPCNVLRRLQYDVVPFVGKLEDMIQDAVAGTATKVIIKGITVKSGGAAKFVSKFVDTFADTIQEFLKKIFFRNVIVTPKHFGPFAILPPATELELDDTSLMKSVALYESFEDLDFIRLFDLDIFDLSELGLATATHTLNNANGTGYLQKIQAMLNTSEAVDTTGFQSSSWCNDASQCIGEYCIRGSCSDGELDEVCTRSFQCNSGRCDFDSTVRGLRCTSAAKDGVECNENSDCKSGRCEGFLFEKTCESLLPNEEKCNEDSDCESGRCKSFRCAPKLMDEAFCLSSDACMSGRCDGIIGSCRPQLGSGSACDEPSDCLSGNCGSDGTCSSKLGKKNENSNCTAAELQQYLIENVSMSMEPFIQDNDIGNQTILAWQELTAAHLNRAIRASNLSANICDDEIFVVFGSKRTLNLSVLTIDFDVSLQFKSASALDNTELVNNAWNTSTAQNSYLKLLKSAIPAEFDSVMNISINIPFQAETPAPTVNPTEEPQMAITTVPSPSPTNLPTVSLPGPTTNPTASPQIAASAAPSRFPTNLPTLSRGMPSPDLEIENSEEQEQVNRSEPIELKSPSGNNAKSLSLIICVAIGGVAIAMI